MKMGLKRCLKILTNKKTGKVHKYLIKWFSEIMKIGKESATYTRF